MLLNKTPDCPKTAPPLRDVTTSLMAGRLPQQLPADPRSLCSVPGGHVNPAVSLAMVILGKLKIWKFPFYVIAQFLGAFAGAAAVFGLYYGKSWHVSECLDGKSFSEHFKTCVSQTLSWTSPTGFCQWLESMQQLTFLPRTLQDTCQSWAASSIRWALTQWPLLLWSVLPIFSL